jgi:hypothetical protein
VTTVEPAEVQPFVLHRRAPEDIAARAAAEHADARLVAQLGRVIRDAETLEDAGNQILAIADAKAIGADLLAEMAAERLQNPSEGQSA